MKLLRRILNTVKNNCRLIWPYDLSLLRTLGVLFCVGTVLWQTNRLLLGSNNSDFAKTKTLYLTLFSERNAMIEFDYELGDHYVFPKVQNSFGKIDIGQIQNFTKEEFQAFVIQTVPEELRPRLINYLSFVLETAQKYQVDPFWVLAVMWTESHFDNLSVSPNSAIGLMQIVPQTGHFITQKVLKKGITYNDVKFYIKEPYINIELGTIYLKKLLERFRNNYRLATVAYNLGPTRVMDRLNDGISVGSQNDYLNKVSSSYQKLTKHFLLAIKEQNLILKNSYISFELPVRSGEYFATNIPLNLQRAVGDANKSALTYTPSWQIISLVY